MKDRSKVLQVSGFVVENIVEANVKCRLRMRESDENGRIEEFIFFEGGVLRNNDFLVDRIP